MTVLVTGATGSIGREVVRALCDRGSAVRAMVHSPGRAHLLPDGVETVVADLADTASVAAALDGVSAALYISPHDPAEEQLAESFVRECERLGVRLVFAGVYIGASNPLVQWFMRRLFNAVMPHYRGKIRIAKRMCKVPNSVVFGVTNYFQNDELIRAEILDGHYVLPTHEAGINRIDLRDVAELVARALTDPSFPAGAYALTGPELVSGTQAARIWSEVLGRPVRYEGDRPDWPDVLARHLSGQKLADYLRTYRVLARVTAPTSAREVAATTRLLGRPLRRYETYVRDMAPQWIMESSSEERAHAISRAS
ncbi:MAG: NmrA family NAD(P)-binding protein [Micromonosporaceae bacterium]|nr:NmrA family NAD(P)-binding protein [Micromonosporaceae bacterium]